MRFFWKWFGWTHRVKVPEVSVILVTFASTRYRGGGEWKHVKVQHLVGLTTEVAQWCEENHIAYRLDHTAQMDEILIPPFYVVFRKPKDAILFKMRWT